MLNFGSLSRNCCSRNPPARFNFPFSNANQILNVKCVARLIRPSKEVSRCVRSAAVVPEFFILEFIPGSYFIDTFWRPINMRVPRLDQPFEKARGVALKPDSERSGFVPTRCFQSRIVRLQDQFGRDDLGKDDLAVEEF